MLPKSINSLLLLEQRIMKLFRRAYISDYVEFDIIFKLCFEMKDCYLKTVT
jgi:hypothetical protein